MNLEKRLNSIFRATYPELGEYSQLKNSSKKKLMSPSEVMKGLILAYSLGRTDKKIDNLYDNDNPYHIDYERQTKLEL
jgi:hypothetical protein